MFISRSHLKDKLLKNGLIAAESFVEAAGIEIPDIGLRGSITVLVRKGGYHHRCSTG
jgi:hypothetical protein